MQRKCENMQVITYTVSRDEMIEAIMRECKTDDGNHLLPDHIRVVGLPDSVDFVYEYSRKDKDAG